MLLSGVGVSTKPFRTGTRMRIRVKSPGSFQCAGIWRIAEAVARLSQSNLKEETRFHSALLGASVCAKRWSGSVLPGPDEVKPRSENTPYSRRLASLCVLSPKGLHHLRWARSWRPFLGCGRQRPRKCIALGRVDRQLQLTVFDLKFRHLCRVLGLGPRFHRGR